MSQRKTLSIKNYLKRLRGQIPPWNMPSDPVQAVLWFFHWLLTLIVRFFWLPLSILIIYEIVINWRVGGVTGGLWSGIVTLFIGLIVWGVLKLILTVINIARGVNRVLKDVNDFQRTFTYHSPLDMYARRSSFDPDERNPYQESKGSKVVEGTIIRIDEETKQQRHK